MNDFFLVAFALLLGALVLQFVHDVKKK